MTIPSSHKINVAVSGIPRGYHYPLENGNWLQTHHKQKIESISPRINLIEIPAHKVSQRRLEGIEVVLAEGGNRVHYAGELDWEDYQRFFTPTLKWAQLCSTGFSDNITPRIVEKKVTLTNAPGLHTLPIAESVLGAMLSHAKNFEQRQIDQQSHEWNQLKNDDLYGRTVLILGLGKIGKRVAKLCQAFDMQVIGCKRRVEEVTAVDVVFPVGELSSYLPQADYIVIAVPLTPQTDNLLDKESLKKLKSTAYLINVGRGKVVDEVALVDVLKNRKIAGAYLDAFTEEPLPISHPFWDLENVFLVPHDSHSSPYIGDRMIDLFCENLARYVAGEPLQHICDPERGY